ncbi:MAG: Crp/Fnr family transcriptional regulator [Polyangiales bacterium]
MANSVAASDQLFARFGMSCTAGTVLFREGDPGDCVFVVQSGSVRVARQVHGVAKTLAVFGPGEFFGELAILNTKPRNASAQALEDSRLLIIDAKTFEAMVTNNGEIAVRLLRKLAERLHHADQLIEILLHRDPTVRVILYLAREAELRGEADAQGGLHIELTRAQVAEQLALTHKEVSDVLGSLMRLDMVREEHDHLVVADVERLRDLLELVEMRDRIGARG